MSWIIGVHFVDLIVTGCFRFSHAQWFFYASLKNGAGGILYSGLYVSEWASERVSDSASRKLCEHFISKANEGNFIQFLSRMCTLCLKKVPTFKLSVTSSNLNRFSIFLQCWKACEICYKTIRHYPSHLRHVASLPWEIKNSNFMQILSRYGRKCKQIAF